MNNLLWNKLLEVSRLFEEHQAARAYTREGFITEHLNKASDIKLQISFKNELNSVPYDEHYFLQVDKFEALFEQKVDLLTEISLTNPYL